MALRVVLPVGLSSSAKNARPMLSFSRRTALPPKRSCWSLERSTETTRWSSSSLRLVQTVGIVLYHYLFFEGALLDAYFALQLFISFFIPNQVNKRLDKISNQANADDKQAALAFEMFDIAKVRNNCRVPFCCVL